MSVPGKVLNRIILERMKGEVDKMMREEQAGFRQDRACTIEQLLDLLCYMELKPGPPPNDRSQGLR